MAETLIRQLMGRGEEVVTEVTNRLLANEAFVEMLKKGIAVKEVVDKQVADGLKRMNVATRKDIARMEARLAALEARVAEFELRQADSAELLAQLAAQNADLVRAVDELRRRARLMGLLLTVALLAGGGALAALLLR